MAAVTSYDIVGKKENVSDIISNISPTKTPFTTMVGGDKVTNTLFQWQEDSLANPNTGNAQVQGFDAVETAIVPTVMRQNYTQILQKTLKVAETTDAVATYGRAKETAYQLAKYSAELKRDWESIMLSGQTASAGSSTVASTTASYQAMLVAGNIVKTGAAGTYMTEALLLSTLQQLYTLGVDPDYIMVPPYDAQNIAGYASNAGFGSRTRFLDNGDDKAAKRLVNVVDVYVSPYGETKVVLNRFGLATDTFIFDPANWKQMTLRPWSKQPLAKTGDAHKTMLVGEFSLKHKNFSASAVVRRSA